MIPFNSNIPKFGFGTNFSIGDGEGQITATNLNLLMIRAIELGVRRFDCSPTYKTQSVVGATLNFAFRTIPRSEFFITSRVPANMMRPELIERSFLNTLRELQIDFLDLYLIDVPFSTKFVSEDNFYPIDANGFVMVDEEENLLVTVWRKFMDLRSRNLVRYTGISNCSIGQLDRLHAIFPVDVVQNEFHLYNQDRDMFDYCDEVDVHYEGYACFGNPVLARSKHKPSFLTDRTVSRVSASTGMSKIEIIIQWLQKQPLTYVIRSDNAGQLEENWRALSCDVVIPLNDVLDLDARNRGMRLFTFEEHRGIHQHREYPFRRPVYEARIGQPGEILIRALQAPLHQQEDDEENEQPPELHQLQQQSQPQQSPQQQPQFP